ncbi:MAG: hypothetical protein LLG97_05800 [Deltaproteobacteria bacterium]|nr:hypothetical protein [Deltaproteobacteria bacterium]
MSDEAFCHLCQPDAGKSCGACCGIYNYADSSREALTRRLRNRTARFRRGVRTEAELLRFGRMVRETEDQTRRFDVIYCCEYVGFLDDGEKRVGCLLHPGRNDGIDLRGVSFYGRELCDGHLCPSYSFLSSGEKWALIDLLDDWYLYGLCVTDIDLVKGYFRHLGDLLGETPRPAMFRDPSVRGIARRFFEYKLTWPFRSTEVNRFGRFHFDGSQHMIRPIDYEALGCEHSRYDSILLSLSSELRNRRELQEAEEMIRGSIAAAAALLAGPDFR